MILQPYFNMEPSTKVNGELESSHNKFSLYLVFSQWSLTEISKYIERETEDIPALMKINFKNNRETVGTLVLMSKQSGDKLAGTKIKDFSFYSYEIKDHELPKEISQRWGFIISLPRDLNASFIRSRLKDIFDIFVECNIIKPDDYSISVQLQSRNNDNIHTGKCFVNFDNLEKNLITLAKDLQETQDTSSSSRQCTNNEKLLSTSNALMNNIIIIKALLQDSIWDREYPLNEQWNRIRCSWLALTTNKSKKKKKFKSRARKNKSSKGTQNEHVSIPDLRKFLPNPASFSETNSTPSASYPSVSELESIVANRRSLYKKPNGEIMSVIQPQKFTIPLIVGTNQSNGFLHKK